MPAKQKLSTPTFALETEFKFFIKKPSDALAQAISGSVCKCQIVQHLFSLSASQAVLLPVAEKIHPAIQETDQKEKLKGRVRQVTSNNQSKYYLGLKGPKIAKFERKGVCSKPEVEIPISEELYKELLRKADKGYIYKTRTIVPCTVADHQDCYHFLAEFDSIENVNGYPLKPKFLILEIEIPEERSEKIIKTIRSGDVKFNFNDLVLSISNLSKLEVIVGSKERFVDLVASRKLVENVSETGPAKHLKKYFYE